MRRLALLLVVLLISASPAGADERTLSESPGDALAAHGSYASWIDEGQTLVLWHDGRVDPFGTARVLDLGSDARRRSVAVRTSCGGESGTDCTVRSELLGARGRRLLYRQRPGDDVPSADMHRGTLVLAAGGRGRGRGIYVRAPGATRLRAIARDVGTAWDVDAGPNRVAWLELGGQDEIHVRDLETGRDRVFAVNDTFDEDCRCTIGGWSTVGNPVLAGRYAYWVETSFPADGSSPTSRIGRARADIGGRPAIAYFEPGRLVPSFAIRGGRIVTSYGRVVEIGDPSWRASGTRIPART